ncbi:uncharacterized protein DFL_004729 [Arthrobotrys flagrans]|uniref:Uncharacterized protein n=1 Tax=Arthrobotrys flagrans TaxID=97331 RepID=A0A437A5Q7_ARTFL|nr:hypothetical protein DFL_004729 [Arthrobotrys flagrans]
MSRAHPAPDSDTMRELILMQAIINAYNAPPKFDIAAKALGITVKAVSGRYNRLKKKVEQAGVLHFTMLGKMANLSNGEGKTS